MTYEEDYSFARACMGPNETVLWRGKPGTGHLLTGGDAFMIPFSIFWCGFAIFWETTAIIGGVPFFFCLFGIPFVCVGLYLVLGRFLWTAYIRKRTAYVITNKKIIRRRGSKVDVLSKSTLPAAQTEFFKDGSGTVRFCTGVYGSKMAYNQFNITGMETGIFALENVPDVTRVLSAIDQME